MTTHERIQAVTDYGFTERQARFLVLVMRHSGLCVKRQYTAFAEYVCRRYRHNRACTNKNRVSVEALNEAVLHIVEEHALSADAIERVVRFTEEAATSEVNRKQQLDRELRDLNKRITNLVGAIEVGGDAAALVFKIRDCERQRDAKRLEHAALHPMPRLKPDVIEDRLAEWRRCAVR